MQKFPIVYLKYRKNSAKSYPFRLVLSLFVTVLYKTYLGPFREYLDFLDLVWTSGPTNCLLFRLSNEGMNEVVTLKHVIKLF